MKYLEIIKITTKEQILDIIESLEDEYNDGHWTPDVKWGGSTYIPREPNFQRARNEIMKLFYEIEGEGK